MECKFIQHGLAVYYDQVARPCCEWKSDKDWDKNNNVKSIDLISWHQKLVPEQQQLANNMWPESCEVCQKHESNKRYDSIRYNGLQSYQHYADDDITLEIRPGSVCNFACQTCWPEASSKVLQFYKKAGLLPDDSAVNRPITNFDFLLPVATRIKNVVVLGGEPFYDKNCKEFLHWAVSNLQSDMCIFTNGSVLDHKFISKYPGKLTIVFSLDAVGKESEYVRFGSVWDTVCNNFNSLKNNKKINLRVNITTSVYNYGYLEPLLDMLCVQWPEVVTFGPVKQTFLNESVIPEPLKKEYIQSLLRCIDKLKTADIESNQKINAINALLAIVENIKSAWSMENWKKFCDFATRMDHAKNISMKEYCKLTSKILDYQPD